jgi:TRAP-type C4-dicarboxylate transport system substrate-binding protein
MTVTRRYLLKSTAALGAASMLPGLAAEALAAPTRWDMSDEYNEKDQTGVIAKFFVSELKKRIGSELDIFYQGNKTLGYLSADHFDAVRDGAVPIAVSMSPQFSGLDPFFNLTSLPFLVKDLGQARTLWQVSKPEFEKIFDANNMVLIYAHPNAPSGIFANKAIASPDDLKGLRIRTYDANGTRTFAAAGAAPLQIAWSDLIPQLSTGAIHAVLTSPQAGVDLSLWDYLKHFTALNYAMSLFMIHANKESYAELSEGAKTAIKEVAAATEEFGWKLVQDSITKSYETISSRGIKVTETASQDVFDVLNKAGADIRKAWLEKVGDRGARVLSAFEAAKA